MRWVTLYAGVTSITRKAIGLSVFMPYGSPIGHRTSADESGAVMDTQTTCDTATRAQTLADSLAVEVRENRRKVDDLRTYLMDNADELGDHATEIAEIFGIELTQSAVVTVTVVHTFEVSGLPATHRAEDIIRDIEWNISFDSSGDLSEGSLDSSAYEITSTEADFE